MNFFINIIVSSVIMFTSLVGIYRYIPLHYIESFSVKNLRLGSDITTINGTDTLSSSRSVINTNFTNLNNGKTEVSSSSIAAITTLANLTSAAALATVGTLTSGSLGSGFTTVVAGRGGTGSTTLSANQVLLGSTTNAVNVVSGWGTSGQFLTSNGTTLAPTWQTSAVDQGIDYTWTGVHGFGSSTPAARVGIQGNAFISGTTTSGGFLATSSIRINNNLDIGGICAGCAATVQSYIPRMVGAATTTNFTTNPGGTEALWAAQFEVPFRQTFQKISFYSATADSPTGLDIKIFAEDGTTVVLATSTSANMAVGVNTITASSTFVMGPGIYWLAFMPHPGGTGDLAIWNFASNPFAALNSVSSEPRIACQYERTVNQFKMPGVIDTTGCTAGNKGLIFRLDN